MPLRSLILSAAFLFPCFLFAKDFNAVQFSGSIIAIPLNAAKRCAEEAAEYKKAQTCSGEAEQATTVTSAVHDFRSRETSAVRREVVLSYN